MDTTLCGLFLIFHSNTCVARLPQILRQMVMELPYDADILIFIVNDGIKLIYHSGNVFGYYIARILHFLNGFSYFIAKLGLIVFHEILNKCSWDFCLMPISSYALLMMESNQCPPSETYLVIILQGYCTFGVVSRISMQN